MEVMTAGGLLRYTSFGDDEADIIPIDYVEPTTTEIALRAGDQTDDVGGDLVRATSVAMRFMLASFGEYPFI